MVWLMSAGCSSLTETRPVAVAPEARPVDPARAQNVFVMLSGGAAPGANNYSQYLQAKAVTTFFERNYPLDAVWTFFGAGNREDQAPVLGDVRRSYERDGLTLDAWLPGALSRNRPAKHDLILRTLREEILPKVRDGGTLFLFVGDHGSQRITGDRESIIDLWTLTRDTQNARGWKTDRNEVLGVAELRQVLAEGLGRGRVVFCMTQCHGGGFHYLAVPREMTPNPGWFTKLPDWAKPTPGKAAIPYVRAAGFTATDELNLAAGCDPDPDPEKWAGYERFMPERLCGLDLFTLQPTGPRRDSFYAAHVEATLVDRTIDKPYSTSEQYLERWASLIETRLAKEPKLSGAVQRQVAAYQRAVDGVAPRADDPAFRERQELFARFTRRLTEENPATRALLLSGSRQQLDEAIAPPGRSGRGPGRTAPPAPSTAPKSMTEPAGRSSSTPTPTPVPPPGGRHGRGGNTPPPEVLKPWNEVIRPAWRQAVGADRAAGLPPGAREFEKYLLEQEAAGKDFLFANARALPDEAYWKSGYADPATLDRAKAEAVVRWGIERRTKILAWAQASEVAAVRAAAEEIVRRRGGGGRASTAFVPSNPSIPAPSVTRLAPASEEVTRPLSRKTAAERVLFYRRTLAAWAFLLALDERPALERIRELTELERTPLPPALK